jgi:poly-beta-1,6-N-acetyl-D-glucosamine synthase
MTRELKYALITPARNEEAFIGQTIQSVLSQTVLPLRWIIVSDGSTDCTDRIVGEYVKDKPWLELIRMPEHRDRTFAAKAHCFNAAYERLDGVPYDIIGNLDADISFEPDYFAYLLGKFAANPKLGVAGTPFVEGSVQYDYRVTNIEHVSGACQLFRRECFEQIGGYVPIRAGGIDWIAVTTARMKGWQTRTFTEMTCLHHRKMGTGTASGIQTPFRHGMKDYYLGGHPLWQLFRSAYQATRKPYLIGGVMLLAGFGWAALKGVEKPVSKELTAFHQMEQMQRLKRVIGWS